MYPHRIRLRGPWQWETETERGTVAMPGELPVPGPLRLRRRFGWPGRLDEYERVWLIFAGIDADVSVLLNDENLGGHVGAGPFEFDITALLRPRNELRVDIAAGGPAGMDDIGLEVRPTAWLRDVQTRPEKDEVCVTGEVTGACNRPLDLYVLAHGSTVGYICVQAGRRFELLIPDVTPDEAVRVELVNGGVVWYVVELPGPSDKARSVRNG